MLANAPRAVVTVRPGPFYLDSGVTPPLVGLVCKTGSTAPLYVDPTRDALPIVAERRVGDRWVAISPLQPRFVWPVPTSAAWLARHRALAAYVPVAGPGTYRVRLSYSVGLGGRLRLAYSRPFQVMRRVGPRPGGRA